MNEYLYHFLTQYFAATGTPAVLALVSDNKIYSSVNVNSRDTAEKFIIIHLRAIQRIAKQQDEEFYVRLQKAIDAIGFEGEISEGAYKQ